MQLANAANVFLVTTDAGGLASIKPSSDLPRGRVLISASAYVVAQPEQNRALVPVLPTQEVEIPFGGGSTIYILGLPLTAYRILIRSE